MSNLNPFENQAEYNPEAIFKDYVKIGEDYVSSLDLGINNNASNNDNQNLALLFATLDELNRHYK